MVARKKHFLHGLLAMLLLEASIVPFARAVPGVDNLPAEQLEQASELGSTEASVPETLESLLEEATELLQMRRPIDARAKLQKALQLNPNDFRPHLLLGVYYLSEVGHFRLAYRYLKTAESHFTTQYGSDIDESLNPEQWRQHARLLLLLSEARLNLDDYSGSLETLDRFGARYWDPGYPGTRAWVLMKLKRVDEAIQIAQAGLLRGADLGRTYNILGILLSLKDNSELALRAFSRAIQAELALGGSGYVATPLNNAGEVYRELFADDFAEAAWLNATGRPDGCEHILPSLNLAILYVDQLRLFQAERVLSDFEACFAAQSIRDDTEHRALLALARGRIANHKGDFDTAVDLLTRANVREQWFGKIGTNENDVRFASTIGLARGLEGYAAALLDKEAPFVSRAKNLLDARVALLRSWWLNRRAREIALDELSDFEDLHIRHTDAMIEYPTLGIVTRGFPTRSFAARIDRMITNDKREVAHTYYKLYLAQNLSHHRQFQQSEQLTEQLIVTLREVDRLALAETYALQIKNKKKLLPFWRSANKEEKENLAHLQQQLFLLHPALLRHISGTLPVTLKVAPQSSSGTFGRSAIKQIQRGLFRLRFTHVAQDSPSKILHTLHLEELSGGESALFRVRLLNNNSGEVVAQHEAKISEADEAKDINEFVNNFIAKAFAHRVDPPSVPVPSLPLLQEFSR